MSSLPDILPIISLLRINPDAYNSFRREFSGKKYEKIFDYEMGPSDNDLTLNEKFTVSFFGAYKFLKSSISPLNKEIFDEVKRKVEKAGKLQFLSKKIFTIFGTSSPIILLGTVKGFLDLSVKENNCIQGIVNPVQFFWIIAIIAIIFFGIMLYGWHCENKANKILSDNHGGAIKTLGLINICNEWSSIKQELEEIKTEIELKIRFNEIEINEQNIKLIAKSSRISRRIIEIREYLGLKPIAKNDFNQI